MAKPTRSDSSKPAKPYKDFPLFPHATKRWAKKIKGKLVYFGPWDDPEGALKKYRAERDDLHAGRVPKARSKEKTISELLNQFLTTKKNRLESGELTPRSFADYKATCDRISNAFALDRPIDDLTPDDFEALRASIAKIWGAVALGNEVQRVRVLFKFAVDTGLVDRPVLFGPGFKRPAKKTLRLARESKGLRMFEAVEVLRILEAADAQLRAMTLLGINCGLGNTDCGRLPISAIDLAGGWLNYPRPKTGIKRRAKLWPETVEALKAAIAARPEPRDPEHADLVFLTKYRKPWAKETRDSPVSQEFTKLVKAIKIHRAGLSFYALRHTLQTVGDEAKDPVATSYIMGHSDGSMAGIYRERIADERLAAVSDHVRGWLVAAAKQVQIARIATSHMAFTARAKSNGSTVAILER